MAEGEKALGPFIVEAASAGERLDRFLTAASGLSRSRIKQLIDEGRVHGPKARAAHRVEEGEAYWIRLPPPKPLGLRPEPIPLDVLYEDAHIIVINKPAGIVVHPSAGHDSGTLVNALLHHCRGRLAGIGGVERPGIVHRLDRDTSGVMVVAKSEPAIARLVKMFAAHDLEREYLAWCRGEVRWRYKRIEAPIGRDPHQRKRMGIVAHGRHAITEAWVERVFPPIARVRARLHTGRTHQVRVHLASEGLPLLGDRTYARAWRPPKTMPEALASAICALRRQALHAVRLAFAHPITGKPLDFTAPLPEELARIDRALEALCGED
ncbi:MAG: RluA family pseudouridine synthase [Zetaproteobacteria bacterium]|nr:MAG: RluA family pseudouridine synthase [Zetaproteobacteria bacterium]